jgi:hypothetical protein
MNAEDGLRAALRGLVAVDVAVTLITPHMSGPGEAPGTGELRPGDPEYRPSCRPIGLQCVRLSDRCQISPNPHEKGANQ